MKNILGNSNFGFKNRIMGMTLLRFVSAGLAELRRVGAMDFGWLFRATKSAGLALLLMSITGAAQAQTTVTVGGGGTVTSPNTPTATWTTPPSGVTFGNWSRGSAVTFASATDALSGSGFNTASAGASYTANKFYKVTITANASTPFSLTGATWLTALSGTGPSCSFAIFYSNNGGSLTQFGSTGTSTTSNSFTGSVAVAAGTSIDIYMIPFSASASTTTVRWKNGSTFTLTATAATGPTISLSTNSLNLGSTFTDAASTPVSYTVSGTNLGSTNIAITPSSSLVEVSTNNSSGFTNAINLAPTAGVVSSTTIFARIASNSTATNNFSASISHVSGSASTNLAVSGTINQAGQPPVITVTNFSGQVGVAFSQTIQASGSPTNFTLVSGTLPGGLTFNSNNGTISGTPTNAVTNSIIVTAANNVGSSSNATIGLAIAKGSNSITFAALPAKTVGDAPFTLSATANSGLAVSYASSSNSVATVSGDTVTIVGAGTTTITASQGGDNNWNPATNVTQELTVTAPPASLTVTPSPMSVFNAANGSNSDAQTLNVVGLNLVNDVVISPVAGFEFSSNGIDYVTNGLSLPKGNGGLTNDISVRLSSNASSGLLGGSISVATVTNGTSSLSRSTAVRGAVGVYWDFTSASPATNAVPEGWTLGPVALGNNNGSTAMITNSSASSGYTGASAANNAGVAAQTGVFNPSSSAYFEIPVVVPETDTNTLTGYGIRQIVFGSRSTGTGPLNYTIRSSIDNYQSDIASGSTLNNSIWAACSNANIGLILAKGTTTIRIYGYGNTGAPQNSGASVNWRIDDLVVTLGSIVNTNPTLSLLPSSITGLKGFMGSPSPSSSYVVKGTNLVANVGLQVSTNAIQISSDNSTFTNQLTLAQTNGVLSNTIYVRLSAVAPLGSVSGSIQNASGSLTNTLSVVGTVYDAARGGSVATLAGWDVNDQVGGTGNFGPSPLAPTISKSDIIVGGMTRGPGVETSTTGAGRAWGGTTWEDTSSADAIAHGKFVTFTLQATSGKTMSLTSLPKFNYRAAGSYGPTNGLIQYQIGSGAFQDVAQVPYKANGNGQTLSPVDLTGIQDLQNVPASQQVTFRIVNWGGSPNIASPAYPGSWYIFDTANTPDIDFEVTGSVNTNSAPTDVSLSLTSIAENNAVNAIVGTLTTTDADSSDTHTYSLVPGTGDTDNASFNISGNSLLASAAFDFETKSSYLIRVRSTDSGGATFEKQFTITVTNVEEGSTFAGAYPGKSPTDIAPNGLSYLANYGFGGSEGTTPTLPIMDNSDLTKLRLVVVFRTDDSTLPLSGLGGETSTNLAGSWSTIGVSVEPSTDPSPVPAHTVRKVISVNRGSDPKKFLRATITK